MVGDLAKGLKRSGPYIGAEHQKLRGDLMQRRGHLTEAGQVDGIEVVLTGESNKGILQVFCKVG